MMTKWSKKGGWIIGTIVAIIIIGFTVVHFVTDYIWMDSLSYGDVYTKILFSKVILALSGFILFFTFTLLTLYWIRKNYLQHFLPQQLPTAVANRRYAWLLKILISIVVGIFGSSIIQGLGW